MLERREKTTSRRTGKLGWTASAYRAGDRCTSRSGMATGRTESTRHARLAIHASQTLVAFFLETWNAYRDHSAPGHRWYLLRVSLLVRRPKRGDSIFLTCKD